MEQLTVLEQDAEEARKPETEVHNRAPRPARPSTPEQAFEAHVAMCFECHNRSMFEGGGGYCGEAYRILAEGE
jgi:hypothetical protein